MNINTNHNLLAFDRQINNSKAWLQDKVFDACGYSSEVLLDRLMQRLVEISLYPYSLAVSVLCKTSSICFPAPGTQINCSRASMEIGSGRVTVTPKQWLANQLDFFIHWAYCLLAILSLKKAGKNNQPAVLIFGVGEEALFVDKNDERFVNYCRLGPIEPLRNGKCFLVQSSSKNVSSDHFEFVYCRRPLISLLREARMGFFGRIQLLVNHLVLFFTYQAAVFRLPQLSLLGRDFAYSCISFELDRRGLIESIILTCNDCDFQPLWIRALHRSKVHMIWYSQSSKPISYSSDNIESVYPKYHWMRVDTHWVWTDSFAEYLRILGHDKPIEVVGPIVWYLPEINAPATNKIAIVIFDTSAFNDEVALGGGAINNYNHPDNMFSFIQDIIALKSDLEKNFQLPVTFRLKTKRGYKPGYDRAYFDYIEELNSFGTISLEHHSTNIYSLISRSHLVIVYPFSSPAYVAEALNVPSIYYDPTKSIVGHNFGDSSTLLIKFANSPDALFNAAISALSNVFPMRH